MDKTKIKNIRYNGSLTRDILNCAVITMNTFEPPNGKITESVDSVNSDGIPLCHFYLSTKNIPEESPFYVTDDIDELDILLEGYNGGHKNLDNIYLSSNDYSLYYEYTIDYALGNIYLRQFKKEYQLHILDLFHFLFDIIHISDADMDLNEAAERASETMSEIFYNNEETEEKAEKEFDKYSEAFCHTMNCLSLTTERFKRMQNFTYELLRKEKYEILTVLKRKLELIQNDPETPKKDEFARLSKQLLYFYENYSDLFHCVFMNYIDADPNNAADDDREGFNEAILFDLMEYMRGGYVYLKTKSDEKFSFYYIPIMFARFVNDFLNYLSYDERQDFNA